jgi:hypothetical protein
MATKKRTSAVNGQIVLRQLKKAVTNTCKEINASVQGDDYKLARQRLQHLTNLLGELEKEARRRMRLNV